MNIQRVKSRLRGRFSNRNKQYHDPDYEAEEDDKGLYDHEHSYHD